MKKLLNTLITGLLFTMLSVTSVLADLDKGAYYYDRYIGSILRIKSVHFVELIGVDTPKQLDELFKDNAKLLIEKLNKLGKKKADIGVKNIIKKQGLRDLKDFIMYILEGSIPLCC